MKNQMHFRVNTPQLLIEIGNNNEMAVVKIPLTVLQGLLAQVARRAIVLDDPVLNRLMFDLALYDLPDPTTKEYSDMMKAVYRREELYLKGHK